MEFFNKDKPVKLRSHLNKYLIADDDRETVRQSRNSTSSKARWVVELVENKSQVIRLKSCHGNYLTASDVPFLLGMTGKKVTQTKPPEKLTDWEPIRDGFQVKLKSCSSKYLRANGGPPPWRNSVTQDEPHTGATKNWILWDVEQVELDSTDESVASYISSILSFSSISDEILCELGSPVSVSSTNSPRSNSPRWILSKKSFSFASHIKESNKLRSGMEFFHNAKAVRLRSHHDKYLLADDDEASVTQDRHGSSKSARWTVELVPGSDFIIRLKSCYGKYLTASNQPFLLGMTGRKVIQSLPRRLDSSVEWEPLKEGNHVKLKTRYSNFLRANGGLPPWRNSVTHDIPHRTSTQDWILWGVDVVEIHVQSPGHKPSGPLAIPNSDSLDFESSSPSSVSIKSNNFSRQESSDSHNGSMPYFEGRTIYYHIADENGEVDDEAAEGYSFTFKGNSVDELTRKFEEDTGIEGVIVCTRSPLNGKLYPLRLQLPPNNVTMQVIILLEKSKAAEELEKQGLL